MSLPSYHVSTPSGSRRPVDPTFVPPSSPSGSQFKPLISNQAHPSANISIPPTLRQGNIVYSDEDCVVFLETKERSLASAGHLTFLICPPLPSIYNFSASSVPLLAKLLTLARSLLDRHCSNSLQPPVSGDTSIPNSPLALSHTLPNSPSASTTAFPPPPVSGGKSRLQERIGFVCSPFKDPLNPSSTNLTLHATLGPLDRASFWTRSGAFGPMGFYSLDDLIAEIRESTSNNRIKTGSAYSTPNPTSPISPTMDRYIRPLDQVPGAGARSGDANGAEHSFAAAAPLVMPETESTPRMSVEREGGGEEEEEDGKGGNGDLSEVQLNKGKGKEA